MSDSWDDVLDDPLENIIRIFIDHFHRTGAKIPNKGASERWMAFVCMSQYFRPFDRLSSTELGNRFREAKLPDDYIDDLIVRYNEAQDLLECFDEMKGREDARLGK